MVRIAVRWVLSGFIWGWGNRRSAHSSRHSSYMAAVMVVKFGFSSLAGKLLQCLWFIGFWMSQLSSFLARSSYMALVMMVNFDFSSLAGKLLQFLWFIGFWGLGVKLVDCMDYGSRSLARSSQAALTGAMASDFQGIYTSVKNAIALSLNSFKRL